MVCTGRPVDEDATLDSLLHALTPVEELFLLEALAELPEDDEPTLDEPEAPWLVSRITALLGDLLAIRP